MTEYKIPDLSTVLTVNRAVIAASPAKPNANYNAFCALNGAAPNVGTSEAWFFMLRANSIAEDQWSFELLKTDNSRDVVLLARGRANDAKDNGDFTLNLFDAVKSNMGTFQRRYVELVSCEQTAHLEQENLTNYYASCGIQGLSTNWIEKVLPYCAGRSARLSESKGFDQLVAQHKFVEYHTTYASTPQLCRKWWNETPLTMRIAFGFRNDDEECILRAAATPWVKNLADAVPVKAVVHTYVYLDSVGQLPRNWYQGNRAISASSGPLVKRLTGIYKIMAGLIANLGETEGIKSIEELALAAKSG